MISYNFLPLNSFDFFFNLLYNIYNSDIVTVLPVLIFCGGVSTIFISFIFYSARRIGKAIMDNAGLIGGAIAGTITTIDSSLNVYDRFTYKSEKSGSTNNGGSSNKGGGDSGGGSRDPLALLGLLIMKAHRIKEVVNLEVVLGTRIHYWVY
jgi:hypothetical protein